MLFTLRSPNPLCGSHDNSNPKHIKLNPSPFLCSTFSLPKYTFQLNSSIAKHRIPQVRRWKTPIHPLSPLRPSSNSEFVQTPQRAALQFWKGHSVLLSFCQCDHTGFLSSLKHPSCPLPPQLRKVLKQPFHTWLCEGHRSEMTEGRRKKLRDQSGPFHFSTLHCRGLQIESHSKKYPRVPWPKKPHCFEKHGCESLISLPLTCKVLYDVTLSTLRPHLQAPYSTLHQCEQNKLQSPHFGSPSPLCHFSLLALANLYLS